MIGKNLKGLLRINNIIEQNRLEITKITKPGEIPKKGT